MILILGITFFTTGWLVPATPAMAQAVTGSEHQWIRPADGNDPAIWGIRDGIVFGLWPYGIESGQDAIGGGPRGLIRVGYAAGDQVYMLNFIAVEPVVNGTMEFSEISPSQVDGKWGKLMWAGDHANARSEEHTSELQSLMRISYAVFCLTQKHIEA